ncbi:hypothetical protein IL306_011785 [Fusarium sp. DS 682]|nr:hypothetical protein IL306_011785 [Fusarium sp. DS 682]
MLSSGLSYNLFFWIEFALGCVLFLATLAFFEETMYLEERPVRPPPGQRKVDTEPGKEEGQATSEFLEARLEESITVPPRKSYLEQCKIFGKTDPNTPENTGLVAIAAFVGYLAAAGPFSTVPDRFSAWLTRRNNNIHEAENRLWCLVVVFFVSPAAIILYGYAAEKHLHWFGLFFAVGMFQFGAFFYLTYTLAYAMDSYEAKIPEMLIAMNVGKQAISFAFGYKVIDWVQAYGYVKVFAGIFCGAITINNLFVFVFLAFGKWSRRWLSTTALSKMHRESMG